jgi:hypothetical protein
MNPTEALHRMIVAAEQSLTVLAQRDRARLRDRQSLTSLSLAGPSSDITAVDRETVRGRGRRSTISISTESQLGYIDEKPLPALTSEPIPEEYPNTTP